MKEIEEQLEQEEFLISIQEIKNFEKELNPEIVKDKFSLATIYIKSKNKEYITKGIHYFEDILRDSNLDHEIKRDSLYFISLGFYFLGDNVKAKKSIELLLKIDTNNSQGLKLNKLLEDKVYNDGILGLTTIGAIGVGLFSGIAAVGVLGSYFLFKKK